MIDRNATFSVREITNASGMSRNTVDYRVRVLKERGEIPKDAEAYTYEQVKKILLYRQKRSAARPEAVQVLKRQLVDDGLARK